MEYGERKVILLGIPFLGEGTQKIKLKNLKMNNLKVLFVIDKIKINNKNLAPLRCRITYNGVRKPFSTGLFINPKNWNSSRQKAVPDNAENNQIA